MYIERQRVQKKVGDFLLFYPSFQNIARVHRPTRKGEGSTLARLPRNLKPTRFPKGSEGGHPHTMSPGSCVTMERLFMTPLLPVH